MEEVVVLIVEDNNDNAILAERQLQQAVLDNQLAQIKKMRVIRAEDALSGVELARKYKPILILMDIHLPGEMDGVQATEMLRQDPDMLDVPIVALTATAVFRKEELLARGFSAYVPKPVTFSKMILALRKLGL